MDRERVRERATERIIRYGQTWGGKHVELAFHAAFPLAITPEMLYLLRENFVPDCPRIAVADLLLSPLCLTVGEELYEMGSIDRDILLRQLATNPRFGENRLHELADFMTAYIETKLPEFPNITAYFGTDPRWISLAYIRPGSADRLRSALSELLREKGERVYQRIATFLDAQEDLLLTAGLEPLVQETHWRLLTGIPLRSFPIEVATLVQEEEKSPKCTFETVYVDRRGKITTRETREAYYYEEPIGEHIEPLTLIAVPAGEFRMGSPGEKHEYKDEKPPHPVTVKAFYIGQTPVTQAQWKFVAQLPREGRDLKPEPSHFPGDSHPVERVSWYDAIEFCARLSRYTGRSYRLPSEAEWEYACRAMTTTPFHFGDTITAELANYNSSVVYREETAKESIGQTTPVRSFFPNAFGLYDMHGNVWEWCLDPWHENYNGAPSDGRVWDTENNDDNAHRYRDLSENLQILLEDKRTRVLCGGSWYGHPRDCRSAYRVGNDPGGDDLPFGFRVVRDL